ncbi:F-box/FBD/LRR-repeat protein At5g22660-like [Chenopodium quinoa]|uniref:FBD domain-containing protein n=1 Tax=Chenopodium quinoa TaxID=63459 RepID=A0A803MF13_CHEQI|nr:F-box/FBD/LRR-repeat protein At5g22660-like [Chenopodium quinoa]
MTTMEDNDRLSSLPDAILSEILSRLPIKSAATTSVLSHRCHHLWTTVTRFAFTSFDETISLKFSAILIKILRQITSPKLRVFYLQLDSLSNFCKKGVSESCFREICCRNVEEIIVNGPHHVYEDCFLVIPAFVFKLQSLVILELLGNLKFNLLETAAIQLPNLKKLSLCYLFDVPPWLEILIRSCTLLEDLTLCFNLSHFNQPQKTPNQFYIFGHNLKMLRIVMHSHIPTQRTKICIDAPKLRELCVTDRISCYHFVQNPTGLVDAFVVLTPDEDFREGPVWMDGQEDYVQQMSKFVQGMSSVSKLDIWVQGKPNVYDYLYCVKHELRPVFRNLVYLDTSLEDIGLIGWKNLLLSMQCFPNLSQLDVYHKMGDDLPLENMKWCELDFVPDCLAGKLKTIKILGLKRIDDELKLLAYILSNADVLKELHVSIGSDTNREFSEFQLWNECTFCSSLFKLPRGSSTCEIMFSGMRMKASSNAYKEGSLSCDIYGF